MNVFFCSHLALVARSFAELAQSPSLAHLLHDDSGQDMIEYALISCFIGLGTVTGIHGLAAQVASYLNIVDNTFTGSLPGGI
jgi:Flp pilus assembly pilin Flp